MIFMFLREALGIGLFSGKLFVFMLIRGIVIYFFGISLARFNKKLMGIRTPFNFILFIMLGSIFASAIIDERVFIPLLATVLCLVLLNGFMTMLAYFFPSMELFIKGRPATLVDDGKIQWRTMRKYFITRNELLNELKRQLNTRNLESVKLAVLDSDGTINFVQDEREKEED